MQITGNTNVASASAVTSSVSSGSSASSAHVSSASQANGSGASDSAHRVLVVDDSNISSVIAQRRLREAGFACDTAANGLEAIKTLQNAKTGMYVSPFFICMIIRLLDTSAVSRRSYVMRTISSSCLVDCRAQNSAR